ncbi:MAG TPA: phenylalanine--tRNA ligase subunit alpha [Bacteroidales bacterium]|nr:phenylalanine--tRNA ligase subunit alpha [Bacteroidales bacterium]
MLQQIEQLEIELKQLKISTPSELEEFRIQYLGKKGLLSRLFEAFKDVPSPDKKVTGLKLNEFKNLVTEKFDSHKSIFSETVQSFQGDITLSPESIPLGSRHPVSLIRKELVSIFSRIGFAVAEGPEIEDDWHVFSGLNFPLEHPARDMQDTFFIEKNPDILLRTHTSSVQVRVMETGHPPIRKVFPGRVFRNEAISARAHCIFHQLEGLYIDKNVSFADLKQTLMFFARELFGEKTQIRLRPSFFPFTEPSAEMDVSCTICGGSGCNVCKYTGYLEILGCGMVDPEVLESSSIDSKIYTGFAFGMGLERIAMLKYQINDLRLYFENDVRFLSQFKAAY